MGTSLTLALASLGAGSFAFVLFLYMVITAPIAQVPQKRWALGLFFLICSFVPASLSCLFALLKIGALKAVFSFYYKIVCLQFNQIEVLFGAGAGTGWREPGAGTSEVGALVTV